METLNVAAKTDKTPPNAPPNAPESKAKDINNTTKDKQINTQSKALFLTK